MHADNHGNRPYALIGQARMICLPFAPRPATTKAAPTKLYVCGQSNDTPHKETQLHSLNSDGECHSSQPASQPAINNNTFPERDTLLPPRSRKTFACASMTDTENQPPRRSTRLRSGTTSSTTTNHSSSYEGLKSSNVSPLRISKSTSRSKTLASMAEDTTLRDISPGSSRRNSPSTFQIKDKVAALQTAVHKSPPASPQLGMVKSDSAGSVRNFWETATANNGTPEGGHKRQPSKTEGEVKTTIRSSIVKNNIFLANDLREREASPKLTMSPSQHRLSAQLGEVQQSTTTNNVNTSSSRIPAPVEPSQSPRKEARSQTTAAEATPKASCLHSTRIKGPRDNVSEDSDSPSPFGSRRERRKTVTFDQAPQVLFVPRYNSQ